MYYVGNNLSSIIKNLIFENKNLFSILIIYNKFELYLKNNLC